VKALADALRDAASIEGFSLLGIAPAVESKGFHDLVQWIEQGYAGEMDYLENRQEAYRHPSAILAGVRSLVVLAFPYPAAPFRSLRPAEGKIARYVWSGLDYHDVIHPKLKRLCRLIDETRPGSHSRGVVDTAPLLEREVARQAGLGWCGKNTLLLNRHQGSYFFLACLLTDVELPYDGPQESSHCGTCTACLEACPTDAFPQPGVLNANRCISYLTIEHRGPIPVALREPIGDWLFGCDVCQEVCPWNRKPERASDPCAEPLDSLELTELFGISDEAFRDRFRTTPLWRSKRRGILRNAAIVLGNQGNADSIEALTRGIADSEPIVRGASAWALGRIRSHQAVSVLMTRARIESDASVVEEITAALANQRRGDESVLAE
jgi:epoxyqueuosine reductase